MATVNEWELLAVQEAAMSVVMAEAKAVEPTFMEAKHHSDWQRWEDTIRIKLATLNAVGTWTIAKHPMNTNVVGSKWVLSIKKNSAGKIEKCKACLVVCGFTQIHSIDYFKTFAPVAKLASFHTILAIAT